MRKALELIAGAAIATTVGLASAQMTPSMPSSPSTKTDPSTSATSPSSTTSSATSNDAFIKLDTDKDGVVSKKEAAKNKALAAKWDTLDTNKDGKLDQGEFAAFEASGSSAPKY